MLLQETKDYVQDVLLPDHMNGFDSASFITSSFLSDLEELSMHEDLCSLTDMAKNILENCEEFTDYVIKAFQDVEADNGFD
ncbi:hypothetical protein [Lentilactobacillus hilgardii]|uniref:hypothetical protein n=1 Tax=Lentilactobacillus hilgardii TaxID=1588 RepID=UPI0021C27D42|nr:hypothetical protein [Lentilactobacillus hilgardii]MCP9331907.1 hypothetical protein [Lentilactobacillus hilgardii]MCP9348474.1 hypothetical protein [Lentilactobacillus hilgardii]MCP9351322.1 hypothetical protein [Lentilactobacillus hilgardii]